MSKIINIFGSLTSIDPAFMMTVDTTKTGSASDTFVLPFVNVGTYSCTVDWGDTSSDSITAYNDAALTHVYASSGSYQISITGHFGQIQFVNGGDKLKASSIDNWGTNVWDGFSSSFYGCSNMLGSYTDAPDLSGIIGATDVFRNCTLFNGTLNSWGVSTIITFGRFLYNATSFNQDVNNWILSTDGTDIQFQNTFRNTAFNQYIGDIDIQDVTNFGGAWRDASSWSTENYGDSLAGWVGWTGGSGGSATRSVRSGVTLRSSSAVTIGSDGEYSRDYLINTKGWIFQDNAPIP